jgi:MFS family permease
VNPISGSPSPDATPPAADPAENPYASPAAPLETETLQNSSALARAAEELHDPYAALRYRDYRLYLSGNLLASLGLQMQKVSIGWEMVERSSSVSEAAMRVGWVGLVQVIPVVVLAIPVGQVVDRVNRKHVIMTAAALYGFGALGLAYASFIAAPLGWMYFCLLLNGIARAFQQPAKAAFLPQIVSKESFSNAVTWNTGGFHLASIVGPMLAGVLLRVSQHAAVVYVLDSLAVFTLVMLLSLVVGRPYQPRIEPVTLRTLGAGLGFVWRTKLILGAITLDMFAVLLGGAVALLPIYADSILHVGAIGLGCLSAAPAVGALTMTLMLAHRRPLERAGAALLWSVAGFGVATIVFGVSRNFWLSLAMLFLTGAMDNISVVLRHTLVQVMTPAQMRGRVAAVNSMFIGASNELGGFESGLMAALFTPTISVISGGIGTLVVVAAVATAWPVVRKYGRLGSGGSEEW